jgi:hypothetical protein
MSRPFERLDRNQPYFGLALQAIGTSGRCGCSSLSQQRLESRVYLGGDDRSLKPGSDDSIAIDDEDPRLGL